MPAGDSITDLVPLLYDAAMGLESWPHVVKSVTEALGAQSALLYTPTLPPDQGLFVGPAIDPAAFADYAAYYHSKDLWFEGAQRLGLLSTGSIFNGEPLASEAALRKSEWYNDFLEPLDISRVLCVVVAGESHPLMPQIHLSIFRPQGEPFQTGERERLAWLAPHLEKALALRFRMEACQSSLAAMSDVLDRFSPGIVLLARDGRVVHANRSAHALCDSGDGVVKRAKALRAVSRHDDAVLQRAVLAATKCGKEQPAQATSMFSLSRQNERRPLQLIVTPLSPAAAARAGNAAAAVAFIVDPEAMPDLPETRIARLLGLSSAEARLTAALAGGASLAEYAVSAGISLTTVRWTLNQVMTKTETNRQSALVALVLKTAFLSGAPS